jgi:hypothetical protein
MATYSKNYVHAGTQFGGVPFGNVTEFVATLEFGADGSLVDFEGAGVPAPDDVLNVFELPDGFQITDAQAIVSDDSTESTTMTVGFAYSDGVDDSDFPQGAASIIATAPLHTKGRTDMATELPVYPLPKKAYLTVTLANAQIASSCTLQIVVKGILAGQGKNPE